MSLPLSWTLLVIGITLNGLAAVAAYVKSAVSKSGALGGLLFGTAIMYFGGFAFWIALMLFFGSSSVASRLGSTQKERLQEIHEKGSRRDILQVVANSGVPVIALILAHATNDAVWAIAAAAGFASANADTWASEIGVLSSRRPKSIITREALEPGTSGGTSPLGTFAAGLGSLVIAMWSVAAAVISESNATGVLWDANIPTGINVFLGGVVAWACGVSGSVIDSVLGATVQAQYRTSAGEYTERPAGNDEEHALQRGWAWVTNDVVNFLSALLSAALAGLLVRVLS